MSQLFNKFYQSESNQALHKMLTQTINSGHLCHAYLLYGEDGIGKSTYAVQFAAAILCQSEQSAKPCMQCASCKKLLSDSHPDVIIIDESDAVASIHIKAIRELRQDAYVMPNDSRYKIYIIKDAQNMSIGAVNALLKVLEEPPKTTIFILTAKSKAALLPTLVSRCIAYAIYPMSVNECELALKSSLSDKTDKEIAIAAEQSNGIIGRAIDILSGEGAVFTARDAILAGIVAANEYDVLKAISTGYTGKNSKEYLIKLSLELLAATRNAILQKLGLIHLQDRQLCAFAGSISMQNANKLSKLFEDIIQKAYTNVNVNLLCNRLSAELAKITMV